MSNVPIPKGVTQEDLSLVRSFLLLTFIHKSFERDCRVIGKSGLFKTPQLYMEMVSSGAKKTSLLLQEVNRELKERGLSISTVHQHQNGVEAHYVCRGSSDDLLIPWAGFRREMMLRMRAYLGLATEFSLASREGISEPFALSM